MALKPIEAFEYLSGKAPKGYACSKCRRRGVKLWREYQTFLEHQRLFCADCAVVDQRKYVRVEEDGRNEGKYGRSDQIGWLVPAVPTEEGDTFWGYTSVPRDGVLWWKRLPLRDVARITNAFLLYTRQGDAPKRALYKAFGSPLGKNRRSMKRWLLRAPIARIANSARPDLALAQVSKTAPAD